MRKLLLLSLLLFAPACWAQVPGTYTHSSSSNCGPGIAATITVNANNLVVVVAGWSSTTATGSIKDSAGDSGQTATGNSGGATAGKRGGIFYISQAAASTSVTFTTSSATGCSFEVAVYASVTSGVLDAATFQENASSTTCASGSTTTTNSTDVVVGGCVSNGSRTFTAGGSCPSGSFTNQTHDNATNEGTFLQDCPATSSTGTISTSSTISAAAASYGMISSFKISSGGGGCTGAPELAALGVSGKCGN